MTAAEARGGHAGRCLCGAVRFVAQGAPDSIAICHCESCRRATGAPFAVYADYRRDAVRFTGVPPRECATSPGAWRGFCADCGASVSYRGDNLPGMIHLHIGLFDDAGILSPEREEHDDARLGWIVGPLIARD